MDQSKLLQNAASLLEELTTFLSSANATLHFASSALAASNSVPPPLFPCPIDPQHRVPAAVLAAHTAACQAAKGGYELKELPSPASSFFYADAPGVVQLRRLPVDQPPRPPLPPQPPKQNQQINGRKHGPPQPPQHEQQGLGVEKKNPRYADCAMGLLTGMPRSLSSRRMMHLTVALEASLLTGVPYVGRLCLGPPIKIRSSGKTSSFGSSLQLRELTSNCKLTRGLSSCCAAKPRPCRTSFITGSNRGPPVYHAGLLQSRKSLVGVNCRSPCPQKQAA